MTVVLLNVKGAFDYVSKTQLLNVIKQLKLPYQLIQWIKSFMKNRKINLLFDDNKNKFFDIESRIFQNSSILSILYFIYVRKIHPQICMQMAKIWNFIDDIVIYLNNKSVKSNCKNLKQIIYSIFDWEKSNMIKFNDLKFELIHFEKSKNLSIDIMKLTNEIILQSQKWVKYFKVFLNRKLNFNIHVQKQLNSVNRVLHEIANLMKFE